MEPGERADTILLVEDEPLVLRLGRAVLERGGYTVLAAGTPAEALAIAASYEGDIHLLVTDVVMPGMSGRVLAEQLLRIHAGMKVLYLSGYTDDAVVRHGILHEEVNFLQKPFHPNALAHQVRELLGPTSP